MRSRIAGATALSTAMICGLTLMTAAPAAAKAPARPYDFNGDGRRDIAIGSPDGTAGGRRAAGFVSVALGTAKGFARPKVIGQAGSAVPGSAETGDRFGAALASADFNRDGYADLAVGAPGENQGAGIVTILWGSPSGLGRASTRGEGSAAGVRHRFGQSLAAGDVQGDGAPELFVSVPGTDRFTWISFTGKGGSQKVTGRYVDGTWLATGDVNGDGRGDVVSAWYDTNGPEVNRRRGFTVFLGGADGRLTKSTTVYAPVHALAVADYDGDRRADVAVGDTFDRPSTGGRVTVHRGSWLGVGSPYAIDQRTSGVPGLGVNEDDFGASLAVGDANGDGRADLAVGAPKADVGSAPDAGRAYVLFGSASGLTGRGARAVSQNSGGVPGGAEDYDLFGHAVSLLDHNGDGRADLGIGAPGENGDSGSVTVVRGSSAGLSSQASGYTPGSFGARTGGARLGAVIGG
ncbi:FG-GAP-like repeat-containing protein [Spirillospora albida]|uniref:FG-GAP-like repeat-containing protein n=1 Tax=Spirillospora albida TaxID=58123 RepID=UPI0004C1DB5D|nr:FG-GAP-like repeat-containing protein [Spirillospora albida]